ncbi:MAG TPA: ABC transporter ATP-binding protein [Acidimicrobiia bacterium]|nr:ABC transporter ATP-binding protein [Acidimicrobiia bacterium]
MAQPTLTEPAGAPSEGRGADVVIEVVDLSKRFSSAVLAVDCLTFQVERGQICGLLGPNGAGKTTALRMLLGLVRPTGGDARILGTSMRPGSPTLLRVGSMIEHASFVPYLSGMRNLRVYWEAVGGSHLADANLDAALAVAGLGDAVHRKVKTYSQGMRQRLGVARALLGHPEVLVLDEPTNGLDPGEMREIRDLLLRLRTQGVTVLLSSHLLSEVEQVCTHAVVMDRGRLVAAGSVDDLIQSSSSAYIEVDDAARARALLEALPGVKSVRTEGTGLEVSLDGTARSALVAALVRAGLAVDTVTSRHRLEDAFLGLVNEGDN